MLSIAPLIANPSAQDFALQSQYSLSANAFLSKEIQGLSLKNSLFLENDLHFFINGPGIHAHVASTLFPQQSEFNKWSLGDNTTLKMELRDFSLETPLFASNSLKLEMGVVSFAKTQLPAEHVYFYGLDRGILQNYFSEFEATAGIRGEYSFSNIGKGEAKARFIAGAPGSFGGDLGIMAQPFAFGGAAMFENNTKAFTGREKVSTKKTAFFWIDAFSSMRIRSAGFLQIVSEDFKRLLPTPQHSVYEISALSVVSYKVSQKYFLVSKIAGMNVLKTMTSLTEPQEKTILRVSQLEASLALAVQGHKFGIDFEVYGKKGKINFRNYQRPQGGIAVGIFTKSF